MFNRAFRFSENIKCIFNYFKSLFALNAVILNCICMVLVFTNDQSMSMDLKYSGAWDDYALACSQALDGDSLKDKSAASVNSTHTKPVRSDDTDSDSSLTGNRLNSQIAIMGNNYGYISIISSDTASPAKKSLCPEMPDTISINRKCYIREKFEFKGYLFSDFVAIDKDKPNGIIQTNAYLSYTRPLLYKKSKKDHGDESPKSGNSDEKLVRCSLFRNIIVTDVTLSKIGNQIRRLPALYSKDNAGHVTGTYFNKFDLLQYSNVIALSKVNIVSFDYRNETILAYIDFIPVFYSTPIIDSLGSYKETNVCTIAFGGNIKLIAKKCDRYSAEIAYSVFYPKIYSNVFNDKAPFQIKEVAGNTVDPEGFRKNDPKAIQALDLRIGYTPMNKSTEIYFKFSTYQNVFRKGTTASNVFVQFQLGSSINFEDIFKPSD